MITNQMLVSFSFLLLLLSFSRGDSLFVHTITRCQFNSNEGGDAVYLEQYYGDKSFLGQYNSILGKFTGNTKRAKEIADTYNKNPVIMAQQRRMAEHCKNHIAHSCNVFLKPVEPSVRLRSVEAASSGHPGMLVCRVYNFYPKQIRVTWLKNGQEMPFGVMSTEKMSNGNWLYQIHSYLEFTPTPGEQITCMVEHASLMEPKLYDWDPKRGIKLLLGQQGSCWVLSF